METSNWHVITGAPCSGKTAVIKEIERRGFHVIHEVARAYIDRQLSEGRRLDQIKTDIQQFERFDFLKDGVRSEDEKMAARLNKLLLDAYGQAEYDVIMVPVMSVKDRADLVLEAIR